MLATAKIHILKQFTTVLAAGRHYKRLCLLLQRYTFWSNSQRKSYWFDCSFNCACYCKDTHFEAIHNAPLRLRTERVIVLATAKIHILKQFTTERCSVVAFVLLCLLLQRYTFWSNSQPTACSYSSFAIVLATAKIHILKQFTTIATNASPNTDCACYCKDTHFEAIHNHQTDDFVNLNSCFDFWSVLPAALQIYSWLSVECVVGCCVERIGLLRRDDRLPNP